MIDKMDKLLFDNLRSRYSPVISRIIDQNSKFYRTNQTIRWQFGFDERIAIFASCNRKTNIITVNVAAVDFSFQQNEPLHIEYFLLHEIRHIFQHMEIDDYKKDPERCVSLELAEKWAKEEENYVTALDERDQENAGYFNQDMELDAFAYSYAVMKYKYGTIPYLYIPEAYQNDTFDAIVNDWVNTFLEEGL